VYVERAAKTKFVRIICLINVDEIDTCLVKENWQAHLPEDLSFSGTTGVLSVFADEDVDEDVDEDDTVTISGCSSL
jgi:hypothetical protein